MRRLLIAYFVLMGASVGATAHDHYMGVYEHNKTGEHASLCCGGDPDKGDCEGLTDMQIEVVPGGVAIFSNRWKRTVFVPDARVEWTIPWNMTENKPAFDHDPYAGHWCGVPRSSVGPGGNETTERQQDPAFLTYCAFIRQGGV